MLIKNREATYQFRNASQSDSYRLDFQASPNFQNFISSSDSRVMTVSIVVYMASQCPGKKLRKSPSVTYSKATCVIRLGNPDGIALTETRGRERIERVSRDDRTGLSQCRFQHSKQISLPLACLSVVGRGAPWKTTLPVRGPASRPNRSRRLDGNR